MTWSSRNTTTHFCAFAATTTPTATAVSLRVKISTVKQSVAEEERDLPRRIQYRVEAVFQEKEQDVLTAIDQFAAKHGLPNRGAVVRLALAKLLRIELAIPPHGGEAGRPRKTKSKRSSKAS